MDRANSRRIVVDKQLSDADPGYLESYSGCREVICRPVGEPFRFPQVIDRFHCGSGGLGENPLPKDDWITFNRV